MYEAGDLSANLINPWILRSTFDLPLESLIRCSFFSQFDLFHINLWWNKAWKWPIHALICPRSLFPYTDTYVKPEPAIAAFFETWGSQVGEFFGGFGALNSDPTVCRLFFSMFDPYGWLVVLVRNFLFFHILGIYNHPNCYSLHHFSEGQPPTRHVHPNPNMVKEVIAPRTTQKPSGFMAALPQGKICRKGAEKRGWSTMVSVEDLASKKAMEQHHGAHRNLVSHVLLGEVNCLSIDMGESTQSTPHHPFLSRWGTG